ncbi:MAG: LptF/LptG family permease [Bacteroidales bacterium]|nr:LptF/LptG family permease [Bacteroidales bacterium]
MKKLDRFILKSYLGLMLLTFSIAMFVLILQFLWQKMESLIGKGLETFFILKMLLYASATIVPMALPLAILLASIMTLGNLGERYELVAMKSAGISLWRILSPLIIFSFFMSVLAFFFSNNIMPKAEEELKLMVFEMKSKKPAINIKPNEFYYDIDSYVIRIGERNKKTGLMKDIIIYDHSDQMGNTSVIKADSGNMVTVDNGNTLIFELYDGENFKEDLKGEAYEKRPLTRINFKKEVLRFDVSNFSLQEADSDRYKNSYMIMNLARLSHSIDSLNTVMAKDKELILAEIKSDFHSDISSQNEVKADFYSDYDTLSEEKKKTVDEYAQLKLLNIKEHYNNVLERFKGDTEYLNRHKIEYHRKFALSLACVILFFIGAPLGAIIKKGGLGMPIVVSVISFVIYYILGQMGTMLARSATIPPWVGMWASTIVFLPIGIFLTVKATSDAKLLSLDEWRRKIVSLKNKKTNNYGK